MCESGVYCVCVRVPMHVCVSARPFASGLSLSHVLKFTYRTRKPTSRHTDTVSVCVCMCVMVKHSLTRSGVLMECLAYLSTGEGREPGGWATCQ